MRNDELEWDQLLKIKTSGRDDSNADQYHYPYEPTPYSVLERLSNEGWIRKKNLLVDYGCGKGRVGYFLSYQTRCKSIGIEYDERLYQAALKNQERVVCASRTDFILENAESFQVPEEADRFYFFNPFSVEILQSVLARIMEAYYKNQKETYLFFYYPSDEYVAFLMIQDNLMFVDEIDCSDLFPGKDSREKILIFELL